MSPLNVLLIDDDPLARANLSRLLASERDVCVVGEAGDGASALSLLATATLELAFVDVELPDMTGFGLLARLPAARRPAIVFTTGHREFAAEAFEIRALDYLLKPYTDERFHRALDRVRRELRQPAIETIATQLHGLVRRLDGQPSGFSNSPFIAPPPEAQFMAKSGNDIHVFKPDQIKWIEAQGDYLKIHSTLGNALVRETMKGFLARSTPGVFQRVHKSAIVNLRYVRRLVPLNSGDYRLELHDGTPVRVSRNFFSGLKASLAR